MLHPTLVTQLRAALAADPQLRRIAIFALESRRLHPAQPRPPAFTGQGWAERMRLPAQVLGTPEDPACLAGLDAPPCPAPPPALHLLADAMVLGNQQALTLDGELHAPGPVADAAAMAEFLAANAGDHQGFVALEEAAGCRAVFLAPAVPDPIPLTAAFLHHPEPGNYGSFLLRQLPQLHLLLQAGLVPEAYVTPDRSPWLVQAIALAGLPDRPIYTVKEVAGRPFRHLAIATGLDREGFIPPATAAWMRRLAGAPGPERRLYVSRLLNRSHRPDYRVLVNEPEIERMAARAGFAAIHPEALSLPAQLRAFAGAARILGPSGSGMLNAAFAPEGGRVADMESFTVTVRQHGRLYASTGKDYAFAFGRFQPGEEARDRPFRSWRMEARDVAAALDWLAE